MRIKKEHTHCDAISFSMVCLVVIPVDGILANNKSGTDGKREAMTVGCSSKDFVDMVHCWDDCGKVGGVAGKEQGCVFEYLAEDSDQ